MGTLKKPLGLLALAAGPSLVLACCVAYSGPNPVSLVDEKAIIIFNPDRNIQHFIRQASFKGNAKDFGFIVPTPSRPTVEVANAKAFARLEKYVPRPVSRGGGSFGGGAGLPTGAKVTVIEEKRVGDYQATILQATEGKALNDWLARNGYTSRPAMTPWLDHYAKQSFYFAALKFVRETGQSAPETSALRISFAADVPFYPYKMPSDTWPEGHYRPMALYYIGPSKPNAVYRGQGSPWEARVAFSGPLRSDDVEGLMKEATLKADDFPANPVLTAYVNSSNAQGYGYDLSFMSSKPMAAGFDFGLRLALAGLHLWSL